jgi:hypothetical protein
MNASLRRALAVVLASSILAPSTLVATSGVALAQRAQGAQAKPKSIRDSLPKEAQTEWDAGLALLQRTPPNYDMVRSNFMRAYNASNKSPRVLFNVAVAEREQSQFVESLKTLERLLEEAKALPAGDPRSVPPEEIARAQDAIKALQPYVMKVTISVSEPGATVFVDKREVGVSPLKEATLRLTAETHTIRATKPGYVEAVQTIPGDKTEVTVGLKMESMTRTADLVVSVVGPKSAVVKIDGNEVGSATAATPFTGKILVSPQPHEITAEANDFVTAHQTVVAREGEAIKANMQLAPEQKKGKLLVIAEPGDATIEIDGKLVGASRWEGPVDAGKHQIAVKKKGYYVWNYDVEVPKGAERSVSARLNEDRNTSFVPWLIGTVVVLGAGTLAGYLILKPKDEDKAATTLSPFNIATPPASIRF